MPRSKRTDTTNNVHNGVRKLSKKVSKKGLKNKKKKEKSHNSSTEEMMDLINSDKNTYTGMMNHQGTMNQGQQNIDPLMINHFVQTDSNGNLIGTNKIGELLGGVAQLNSGVQQYVPPNMSNQQMMSPTMPQMNNPMMQQMNNSMMQQMNNPMMQQMNNPMQQMQQMPQMMSPTMQQMNNHMPQMPNQTHQLHNLAGLSKISQLINN